MTGQWPACGSAVGRAVTLYPEVDMSVRHGSSSPLLALLVAATFVGCEAADPVVGPGEIEVTFHHNPGHGNGGKGGDGGGGSGGSVTATLSGGIGGTYEDVSYGESNRRVQVNGGRGAETAFGFALTHAAFTANPQSCVARRDNGQPVDEATRDRLAAYMIATLFDTALEFEFDKNANGGQSRDHKAVVTTFDDGVTAHVGITGHNDPQPTIARDGDSYTVIGGVVRVWLREGSPKQHPKLFCPNAGDVIGLAVSGL
jgi:hypothetical protein